MDDVEIESPDLALADMTELQSMLSSQTAVLALLARRAPLDDALSEILSSLEHLMPGSRCSIMLYDAGTGTLTTGAAPSLPASYLSGINGMTTGPMAGSCGTAAHFGHPVIASDIATDPRWHDFADLAQAHGLRSCWSTPIHGRSGITGTFAVYRATVSTPSARDQMLVDRYSYAASVAIDQAALIEEEVARRAAELASENKSAFVTALSHEIRNPLQSIAGLTEMLRSVDMPAERRERALDLITGAAGHIADLVDDVLDLARIESGALPLRPSDVDLEGLLHEVHGLVQPLADRHDVTVEVEACPGSVRTDPRRLRQVLLNLAVNAVIHNNPGGRASLSAEVAPDRVTLQVADNGPGMDDEALIRLFIPFERLGADDRHSKGAGLGMALALALIEALGGTLRVSSTVGAGTTAVVSLPRVIAADMPR